MGKEEDVGDEGDGGGAQETGTGWNRIMNQSLYRESCKSACVNWRIEKRLCCFHSCCRFRYLMSFLPAVRSLCRLYAVITDADLYIGTKIEKKRRKRRYRQLGYKYENSYLSCSLYLVSSLFIFLICLSVNIQASRCKVTRENSCIFFYGRSPKYC